MLLDSDRAHKLASPLPLQGMFTKYAYASRGAAEPLDAQSAAAMVQSGTRRMSRKALVQARWGMGGQTKGPQTQRPSHSPPSSSLRPLPAPLLQWAMDYFVVPDMVSRPEIIGLFRDASTTT